ncbi:LLM class flavin-dependent oxidoreductase [Streptomyces sp. KL116D]|uniref:LLM class flavin-dependent oxidoreductase n=1 Tax=Streptomyces sp. KL116D TaxID=3045152 RepID=UPI003558DC13
MSGGRFLLGLGPSDRRSSKDCTASPFARPLTRMRETVEIVRMAAAGEDRLRGREFTSRCPATTARCGCRCARARTTRSLATLSPKMLRLTSEVADSWLGTSFVPEGAKEAYSTTSTPDSPPPARTRRPRRLARAPR